MTVHPHIRVPITIYRTAPGASEMPRPFSEGASGVDLRFAPDNGEPVEVRAGEIVLLPTGIGIELPPGYEAQVRLRSSSGRSGLICPNGVGTIDQDYRGEIFMMVTRITGTSTIAPGQRVGQLVIAPVVSPLFELSTLSRTLRGGQGFGSTGDF